VYRYLREGLELLAAMAPTSPTCSARCWAAVADLLAHIPRRPTDDDFSGMVAPDQTRAPDSDHAGFWRTGRLAGRRRRLACFSSSGPG
jgi:hypothetical protein